MDSLDVVDGLKPALVVTVVVSFDLLLLEFDEDGLVEYHFVGGEEGADESAAGVEDLGDEGVAWQFQLAHQHDHS